MKTKLKKGQKILFTGTDLDGITNKLAEYIVITHKSDHVIAQFAGDKKDDLTVLPYLDKNGNKNTFRRVNK